MIEIGTLGFPYRVSAIAVGTAMSAEADGSQAVWFPDQLLAAPEGDLWQEAAGPLAAVVPNPLDLADPVVAAASVLLATRRMRVGLLALELDADPHRSARTIATLEELAPGRVTAAVDARAAARDRDARTRALHDALAALAPGAELILAIDDEAGARLAERLGRGWLLTDPASSETVASLRSAAPDVGGGVYLPIVVHEDELLARKALEGPLLSALGASAGDAAEHIVVGTPDDVLAALHTLAASGITRVVLDNLLPLGLPDEFEGAQRAVRAVLRTARLQLRDPAA